MNTYKITYRLPGVPNIKIRHIPSFSPEEAETEFKWIIKTCYDCEPEVISVEEALRNGSVTREEL